MEDLQPYLRSDTAWDSFLSKVALVGAAGEALAVSLSFLPFAEACGVPDVLEAVTMQPSDALPCLSVAIYAVGALGKEHCFDMASIPGRSYLTPE